jgi:hypothetical protein
LELLLDPLLLGGVLVDDLLLDLLRLLAQIGNYVLPVVVELVDLLFVQSLELLELVNLRPFGFARSPGCCAILSPSPSIR